MKDEWKTFESFCQFSSGFLIFICPATKKNAFVIFLYLCHTWITGTFGQLTFLWFDFYEQWLKNPYLCFLGQRLLKFWVCFQFQERIMHRMLFFEYFFVSSNLWCSLLCNGKTYTPPFYVTVSFRNLGTK